MIIFHHQRALSLNFKSSRSQIFFKIDVLKNLRTAIVLKSEIFKNTYFEEHLRTAASVLLIIKLRLLLKPGPEPWTLDADPGPGPDLGPGP